MVLLMLAGGSLRSDCDTDGASGFSAHVYKVNSLVNYHRKHNTSAPQSHLKKADRALELARSWAMTCRVTDASIF